MKYAVGRGGLEGDTRGDKCLPNPPKSEPNQLISSPSLKHHRPGTMVMQT